MAQASGFQFILGGYMFNLTQYSIAKYGRTKSYRWAGHDLIGREPIQQFIGEGVETISLSGVAYPQFNGKMYALDAVREIAAQGKPVPLITGGGIHLGKFIILKIKDKYTQLMDDHRARKNEFSIDLKSYGEGF